MLKKVLIAFFLMIQCLYAQDGTRVYEFVNLTSSPRQAALGGNVQSAWDADPNMALWNPALMNEEMDGQLGLNYTSYLADITYGTLSLVYTPDNENFFSLHTQYVDYGTFQGADIIGNLTSEFTAKDAAITLGYARKLSDFFTIGSNIKYINSNIEQYTSSALAADVGIVFHDIDYDTNVSLSFRNIGFQLQPYNDENEKLPFQINLGISHILEYAPVELSLTLRDLQTFDSSEPFADNGQETGFGRKLIDKVSVGAELFPQKAFNLRIGYNFRRGNELTVDGNRNFTGLTYGFGFRVHSFRFEYGYSAFHAADNANYFGILINLDRLISGRDYYRWKPRR